MADGTTRRCPTLAIAVEELFSKKKHGGGPFVLYVSLLHRVKVKFQVKFKVKSKVKSKMKFKLNVN